ncbi:tubulin polyglutamylase ttll6 [Leptinotarsa decemlineata]|uniref:tubulin polyglutamylase ttll6 n=1 Tax=Leptinotarsa decemlineata TaxID=7539 RepID=UPI000C255831|nr:tubulin polyglutamylase ttll6-like [Leptinotarsa decemlineata]
MASESNTSIPLNDISDSSDWSSSDEKQKPPKKVPQAKISKKSDSATKIKSPKKRKRVVTVCLTHCRYDVIRRVAQKFNYREVSEGENWNMYWTDLSITVDRCKEMRRFQKINHFPGMLEICRKDLLARNLNRMLRMFPRDYNFFPKTWCFPADLGEALTYSRLRKNKTFILKPEAGSQGRGIVITKTLKEIRPCDRGICQVYITKPFLIDGYKFDLRVYTLITSCDPLRIFIYNEGLVRFATSRYKEPNGINITNVFMHLTNYAVNKHSRTYNQDTEGGSKRKLSWFNNYLKSLKHDVEAIWYRIDDVIIKTIISAYPVLKHSYAACFPNHDVIPACCELLGIDILLDKRMNPQVLEVNHSPSFHTDTELDCEVKEALLYDMFAMMNLEICDKRKLIREDRKRVRERLLSGSNPRENQSNSDSKYFTEYFKQEMANRGGFRIVYPCANTEHNYMKYFEQGQNSLYCDTASSRAREAAQNALRDEMQLKAKLEASKRISARAKPILAEPAPSRAVSRASSTPLSVRSDYSNSFEAQSIVEYEEKERLQRLAQRDYLVRSQGILELIYFSMKKNNVLRPHDERKYAIFDKIRQASETINKNVSNGPEISDMLEEIHGKGMEGTMTSLKREIYPWHKPKNHVGKV